MAETLLSVVNEVLKKTKQTAGKTAFSDNDDTNFIVELLNDALEQVYNLAGTEIDTDGTITITPSTRTFNGPAVLDLSKIYSWSFRINNANGDIPIELATEQFITQTYPKFETEEGEVPLFVYIDNNKIAIYPLLKAGSTSLTLQFSYPAQLAKKTATNAFFPWEDRSDEMTYIKLYAKYEYELDKGIGQPLNTKDKLDDVWAKMVAKLAKQKKPGFIGARQYGA